MARLRHIAVILLVWAMMLVASIASAQSGTGTKTRVWGFDLVLPPLVGLSALVSAEHHQEKRLAYDALALGNPLAAKGVGATASDTFQILDGVRRAKAAQLSGLETIAAEIDIGGRTVAVGDVPISSLLSPKSVIDTVSTPNALSRWLDTLWQTAGGSSPPPIRITPGANGTPIDLIRIGRP